MVKPNKTCEEGYYCRRGAESGTPNQGTDANICPEGHYCPNGTGEPSNCPKGTLNNRTGMFGKIFATTCDVVPLKYHHSRLETDDKIETCLSGCDNLFILIQSVHDNQV